LDSSINRNPFDSRSSGATKAMLRGLSLALSLAAAEHVADVFADDGLSLLQRRAVQQQVVYAPNSPHMHLVGRYDVAKHLGDDVIRFDAAGFEISFRVMGATDVKVAMSQKITGPGGWYTEKNPLPELEFVDACMLSKNDFSLMQDSDFISETSQNHHVSHVSRMSEGAGLGMLPAGSQPHHFLVYIDGVPQWDRLPNSKCLACTFDTTGALPGRVMEYTVAQGLDPWKSHHIRIVKGSEPDFSSDPAPVPNWLALHSLILDHGVLQDPDRPRNHKIEFLGDSFMSGYCNTCKGTVCQGGSNNASFLGGEPPDTFRWGSFALAWPHLLCEDLQAECHATVLSGMGIHCNTHAPGDTDDCSHDQALPLLWRRTLASDAATSWAFKAWTPGLFLLQAASNDHFDDPIRDQAAVLAAYDDLFDLVYETYPDVHILLVCGPFSPLWRPSRAAAICPPLKEVVQQRIANGAQINMLDLCHLNSQDNLRNCCGHPDRDFHKVIKDHVAREVTEIIGRRDAQHHVLR